MFEEDNVTGWEFQEYPSEKGKPAEEVLKDAPALDNSIPF